MSAAAQRVDVILVAALLLNFLVLGSSRIRPCIRAVAAQGALLSALPLLLHAGAAWHTAALSLGMLALKGMLFPWLLMRTLREASIRTDVEPLIGPASSLLAGAAAAVVAFIVASRLPALPVIASPLLPPVALATLMMSLLVLVSRTKAVTQVVGYLMLENGIFVFGLMLVHSMPFLVELGVLLDLFTGVFVMGIVMYHINREFDHIDTSHLTALKD